MKVSVDIIDYILIRNFTIFLCLWLINLSLSLSRPPCITTAPEDESSLHHLLLPYAFPCAHGSSITHPLHSTCCTLYPTFSFTPCTRCPTSVTTRHCLFPAGLENADCCLDSFFFFFFEQYLQLIANSIVVIVCFFFFLNYYSRILSSKHCARLCHQDFLYSLLLS